MSDWITLTIATRNGGRARVRRDAITSYRDSACTDGLNGEWVPCRIVCTADDNMAVTETVDELRALIEGGDGDEHDGTLRCGCGRGDAWPVGRTYP